MSKAKEEEKKNGGGIHSSLRLIIKTHINDTCVKNINIVLYKIKQINVKKYPYNIYSVIHNNIFYIFRFIQKIQLTLYDLYYY